MGSGWLFSPFICAQIAGGNALVSWVIGTLFMFIIALPLCELGTMFPVPGGMSKLSYLYSWHGSRFFIFLDCLAFLCGYDSIEIQAILQYSSHFFPSLTLNNTGNLELTGLGYL